MHKEGFEQSPRVFGQNQKERLEKSLEQNESNLETIVKPKTR